MQEVWKDIKGYEGLYQVSNLGNVRNIKTKKNLKGRSNGKGYQRVALCNNGIPKGFSIHRLVAFAFVPNSNNLPEVNHKDENKRNNSADNLEWCSHKYNNNYGTKNKRIEKVVFQCDLNGKIICTWPSVSKASKFLHINKASISQCCNGKYKTAGGFVWKYESIDK